MAGIVCDACHFHCIMLKQVDYNMQQHATYAAGRAISLQTTQLWMEAFSTYLPTYRPLTVLDLGSGTGRFSPALAETFGGPVFGVEPSQKMREIAGESATHPAVTYLEGEAGSIPLPDQSVDAILLFLSFHHIRNRAEAAQEMARVLRPGGRILIRSTFADRMPDLRWHHFFPRAKAIETQLFPSTLEVMELFSAVGIRLIALDAVREQTATSLAESAARLKLRAISTFEFMSEDEIREGFARLDTAVAAETTPTPLESLSDLMVLG